MSESKHTPGPWRVVISGDLAGRPGIFQSKDDCCIVHWDGFLQRYWSSARSHKEMHANTRLIASAPDLLESLQEIVAAADGAGWSQLDATLAKARDAIAKATGGTA